MYLKKNNMEEIMKKLITVAIVLSVVFGMAFASGAGEKSAESDAYTIALIAPLTGDNAQYGNAFITGISVLIDEVNAAGGINGKPLKLETFDDAADAAQSTNMAQIVTSDEKYIAAIGSYTSTCALAFGPIFDEAGMPVLVPNSGNSHIATDYNYTFQRGMIIPTECALQARNAVNKLGGKRIAFIALNNDAGLQFKEYALAEMENIMKTRDDVEVVAFETFNEGEVRDYSALVMKIKEAKPDTIVVNLGYVECAAILVQAQQVGLTDVQWLGNQSMFTEDFTKLVGDAGIGFCVNTGFYPANPDAGVQEFVAACKAKDGKEPNAYQRNSYDCAAMVAECLKNGATTREELYQALLAIGTFTDKTGSVTWKNRQTEENYLILKYMGNNNWELQNL